MVMRRKLTVKSTLKDACWDMFEEDYEKNRYITAAVSRSDMPMSDGEN